MRRRREPEDKSLPKWRKISGGVLYLKARGRRRIKPKESIRATQEEISRCMPDGTGVYHFELIEDGKGKNKVAKKTATDAQVALPVEKEGYYVKHVAGGWYNVVSEVGKVMNEKKLKSAAAKGLKDKLEEETAED